MASKDDDDKEGLGVSRKIMIVSIFSLLAVVLLIFLLHFYSRYLLIRRRERRRRAALQRLSRQIAPDVAGLYSGGEQPKVGLAPSVIASLPEIKFKLDGSEPIECSVCLGNITEDAMVRVLPNCKHMFHKDCIDVWFGSNTTCPICRTAAEPTVVRVEEKAIGSEAQPSAPPLEEAEKSGASGSRFGSFRWMVNKERSSRIGSCGDEIVAHQDLERQ